jgi:hypothetical protein
VIPDDSNPDFLPDLRLMPRGGSQEQQDVTQDEDMYLYERHHELTFSIYDACRKDSLVTSTLLDADSDLALLGSVTVSIDDMLQRIAKHEQDPSFALSLKLQLIRDKNQNLLAKTFENLGKGVNMITELNFFSNDPEKHEPTLVLNLVPIRSLPATLQRRALLQHAEPLTPL